MEETENTRLPSDTRAFLGMGNGENYAIQPSAGFNAADAYDERTAKERRARAQASAQMLFGTDVSKLDDAGASALYQSVTEGLFGLPDEDGSVAFGKRAAKDPRQNIEMLRRFVKGEYSLIEDPEYTKWREMDDEAKFKYALENETATNKMKSNLKGERGASFFEMLARSGTSSAPMLQLPEEVRSDILRRSNYETLTDEEKAQYRADVVADYDEKLSRRQTLATFLSFSQGLSDRASHLLAKSFADGTPDANVETLPEDERDRVYSAFSLMRGDQKSGTLLLVPTDFTDDTVLNRVQLGLYGLQQSVVGLATDTWGMAKDAALWTYAKTALSESERADFFKWWDAQARAEQAMKQQLPDAQGFVGEAFQGVMENLHWFIPYGAIGKGGKMVTAARGLKESDVALKGWKKVLQPLKDLQVTIKPMRLGGDLKEQKATYEAGKAAMEAGAAATKAAWTLDVNGVKKLGDMGSAILARQMAAVERYTQMLQGIDKDLKAAKWWKDAAGTGMWMSGEASAFSAFASEYIANADAAGISREESVLTAAAIGLINAQIERLYVPGLESSLSPAQIKSLTFAAMAQAVRSDGAAGFRKWLANRISYGVREGAKVAATEGIVEEPLQQMAVEHGKAFDKLCQELRKNGQATLADEAKALWDSFAETLPKDYATFIDTAADMLPSSVGFGVTTVGNMTRRQHLHNVMTRHANRRAGSTSTMGTAQSMEELLGATDYDAGVVDVIQRAVDARTAVEKHWRGEGGEAQRNPHRFEEAITAARQAFRDPQTGDVVGEVAKAAGVDVKTAEVLTQYLQTEAEAAAFSPTVRAWTSLNRSLADIDEKTIKTVLPGYVEGSFASDPDAGVYSGKVRLADGTERTIAYKVGDLSEELMAQANENARIDSAYGKSFDARHAEIGDGVTWAALSDQQRYMEAVRSQANVNGFSSGTSGVFELTDAKGEKVRVNADDVIYLASGRIADIGYGPAATQGTVRHETFHALWRFIRASLADADVQSLAKTLGVDVTKDGWEIKLDEKMAHQMERYASGHYVSHAVSSRFDRMLDGFAGRLVNFFAQFGQRDEVTDPQTGKPYQLKDIYDKILRGELGSGALGVELAKLPAQPTGEAAVTKSAMPVEVTDAERAEQEAAAQAEAAKEVSPAPAAPATPAPAATTSTVPVATSENPADASTPNQRFYRVGLPNSNVKLVGRLEVRDAETGLVTSTDSGYHDRGNQNRDDRSEESRALVERIGANPDPLQIGTVQPIASNGVVWMLPNGDVIIGNHRVNGARLAYEKGTAGELEKFVREDAAKRGIEIGEGVRKPLLVFVLERIESPDGKADVHEVVRLANESQNRGFNVREQAGNDAKILIDNDLLPRMAFRADGRIDETKSGDAIGKFRQESGAQGMIAEDGSLTEEGQTRLTNAALAALLGESGNAALLQKIMSNAGRLDMQNELRALMKMTPELMALGVAKPAYDLRAPLAEALQLFTEWRDKDETARVEKGKTRHDWRETAKDGHRVRGVSWEQFMAQGDMFRAPSDEAKILGDLFARAEAERSFDREDVESAVGKKRAIDLISDYLADYVANARAVNTETEDMFGTMPSSRAEVMAAQRARGENGPRFSMAVTPEQDAAYMDAVNRGDMETAGRMVREAASRNGYKVSVFHGTPSGGFSVFKTLPAYVTESKEYADRYQSPSASSIRFGKQVTQPETKSLLLDPRRMFDTRRKAVRKRFFGEYAQGGEEWAPVSGFNLTLSRRGLPDWTEAESIADYIRAKHLPYDSIVVDEGGYPDLSGNVQDRGISYAVLNSGKLKSADPVTYDSAGNPIPLSQRFNRSNPDIRYSIGGIYTGTAADYANRSRLGGVDDGPSLLKIGTGEGSQVYGWGLYGSTVRGVAEGYAKDAREYNAEKNGKRIDLIFPKNMLEAETAKRLMENGGDVRKTIEKLKRKGIGSAIIKELEEHGSEYSVTLHEHLYEQTFFTDRAPGDESHLLKWYEPVSAEMQSRLLDAAVSEGHAKREGKYVFFGENTMIESGTSQTGEELYGMFKDMFGSPKAASEWLAAHGIDGVKYPVDSYGKTVKDGDKAGWNYVSFRDDNIRVDHKWTDGQQRYSIATLGGYMTGDLRELAHKVKDGDDAAIEDAGRRLAAIIPPNAVLVPMPSHTGEPTTMRKLADAVAANAEGATVVDALRSNPHESNYAQKKRGRAPMQMEMDKVAEIPRDRPVFVVDNVFATGTTAAAALNALPNAHILAIAESAESSANMAPTLANPDVQVEKEAADRRYSLFAGEKTATPRLLKTLAEAKAMLGDGAYTDAARREIFDKTGWWRGTDGKWRVELPNLKAKYFDADAAIEFADADVLMEKYGWDEYSAYLLGDLVAFPKGLKANTYDLGSTLVFFVTDEQMKSASGGEDASAATYVRVEPGMFGTQVICEIHVVDPMAEDRERKGKQKLAQSTLDSLTHELQHVIQLREGFAFGGNTSDAGSDRAYGAAAGEVEARNAARRNAQEKRAFPPWKTEDVPARYQSVGYAGWEWTDENGWQPMAETAALSPASVSPAAEGRRYSVSGNLLEAMERRERKALEPSAPQGESPFFSEAEGAVEMPIRALRTRKNEPQRSIKNAWRHMENAAAGRIPKRAPVSVVDNGDGTYTVIDGNATTWAAARGGLESVRAKVVGKDRGTALANSHYLVKNDLSGRDADDVLRTHGLEGLAGEAAREKAYEQANENAPLLKAIVDGAAKDVECEAKSRKTLKKRQRVDEKAREYNNKNPDYSRVVDIIGGTLILDPSKDMTDALRAIRKNLPQGTSIAQVKKLSNPDARGYWDVKVSVRFKNGGIGEIILVDGNILDAKNNRGGHDLYDVQRVVSVLAEKYGGICADADAALKVLEQAIYSHGTPNAAQYQGEAWERAKASASTALTRLASEPYTNLRSSSSDIGSVKSLLEGSHLQQPASLNFHATPARSFIEYDISSSSLEGERTNDILSNSGLTVNAENDKGEKKFSTEAPRSGLAYPSLMNTMSDEELLSAAVAARIALGKSDKVSDRSVKVNTVQKLVRRLHPEWDGTKLGVETQRIVAGAQKFAKRIREDLDRGVSESLILEHLPDAMRSQFGAEMRQEARQGAKLGAFGARANAEIAARQARIVEDAVRVQTGIDADNIENAYGINLSETIMHLAENPLAENPPQNAGVATDSGEDGAASAEGGGEEMEQAAAEIDAKVRAAVADILAASRIGAEADERNRQSRRAAAGRDAERAAEMAAEDAEGSMPDDSQAGEGDMLAAAVKKEGLDLENPRHLARFVAELARRQWIQEHGLGQNAEVWHDLVAVQFLRKTAQSVYAKLCRDLTYSRSRETAMSHIAKLDAAPTVAGLMSEMEFVGALINAQRIRETQKQKCEKLDLFLREKFGAQGRFKPDKEEGKRNVSTEAELRARYMRHAMWLTPAAAEEEARLLQEALDALSVDFKDAGRDRDQSREFVETVRKLNVLREFGALRYKPIGEIDAAAQWWENFERGSSDEIVREMFDRDIRTKKAAHLLAAAFADPGRKTVREGGSLSDKLSRFITGHMGFVSLLQDCMRFAPDADVAAAKDILDYIAREVQRSGDRTEAEKRRHNEAFYRAVESIYGKSFNAVMRDMAAPDERFTEFMGVVGGKRVTPTRGRALQLLVSLLQEGRKVLVEDEDNPGQMKMEWIGGYHDNIVKHKREGQAQKIMRLLTPADMNMIKWLGQWYEQNRSELSDVCDSLFGIGVYAELPNYFPVKMLLEKQGLEKGEAVGWTIFPKALTPRVRNERDFDTSADIFSMWAARMEEAAQWKHHAQLGLEMRGIFGRGELQASVIANHGASVNSLMQGFITDILAGHGTYDRSTAGVQYFSDQIRGWTALCALGGNVGVMAKQTTSIPAFGFEIGLVNTAKYMVEAFTPEGMAAMRRIWDSEQRRTRWQVGSSEVVRNALNQNGAGALKRMFQASMVTNKIGDVVPALVVGQGIYRDCLARGMSEDDAMAETWSIIERTQQSGRMENQTSIQRRNKLGRIMFQFLSTQQQYLQYETRAIRDVIARPDSVKRWGTLGRALLLNHFILSSAYFWMGQLYKACLGQEPPDDELKDWLITCLLGPYGSLMVAGFMCKATLERAIKGYSLRGPSMLPMEQWIKTQVNDGTRLMEAVFDSEGDTWDEMLEAAGRWMSDFNSTFRDLRKLYRFRVKGETQK